VYKIVVNVASIMADSQQKLRFQLIDDQIESLLFQRLVSGKWRYRVSVVLKQRYPLY